MKLTEYSARGLALQSRVTLAFRSLSALGYLVRQRVDFSGRYSKATPFMCLVSDLRTRYASGNPVDLTALQVRNVSRWQHHGLAWWETQEQYALRLPVRAVLHLKLARGVDPDNGYVPVGQELSAVHEAARAALLAEGLVVTDGESLLELPARGAQHHEVRVMAVRCPDEVIEAAAAAKAVGGDDALLAVLRPFDRKLYPRK